MNPLFGANNGAKNKGAAQGVQRESIIHEYIAIIMRGKFTVLLTFGIVFGVIAWYTFTVQPVYEASSLVLIDMRGRDGALPVFDIVGTATANKITNELEALKSNANITAVANALIARRYSETYYPPHLLKIIRQPEGAYSKDSVASVQTVITRLSNEVEFTPIRESDIIRITARSTDPWEAALIANVYTEVYSNRNLSNSRQRSQALREFLQAQVDSKRTALDTTEMHLQQYMKQSGVVTLDADANKTVDALSALEAQRDAMEVEKSSMQKTLASYQDELTRQEPNAARAIGESNDSYIHMLQEQLGRLEVQRDVTIAQNPGAVQEKLYSDKLKEINGQIKEIKKKLDERTKEYLKSLLPGGLEPGTGNSLFLAQVKQRIIEQQIGLTGLNARISALNGVIAESERKFNTIPQKSINLARLQRSRLSSEKLYLLVEEKYNEAAIKEKSEFGNVDIMDQAAVPSRPVSPKVPQNLLLGFILGMGLGIGIVFVRAVADRYIRTPEDLKRCGFVPLSTISTMNGEMKKIEQDITASKLKRYLDPHLITHYRPLSPMSESYRHLRAKVQYVQVDKPLHSIVVTSCNPKEGKTTTTANLAVCFSQTERKVLLVDADMRRASVHTLFGLRNLYGLNEHLFGKATVDEVIQKEVLPNLDILTCGMLPPNPAEILGSKRMKDFIGQMKQRYDIVLFDAPPLLAVTDAAVLATEADGVLLVASAGETHAAGLERIAEFLDSVGVKMLGVVLNRFDAKKAYGNSYSTYASYHYGYYGYELGYHRKNGEVKVKKQ
ncbi:MAG TPA: polysaccharide biosynthesis tyrosine autokinase [Bacteroidota bacterium]|nr:polysaccharide biosynthesis tyrosine autokinase [Bacteroidota bacterium]